MAQDNMMGVLPVERPQARGIMDYLRDPYIRAALAGASRGFAQAAQSGMPGMGYALSQGLAGAAQNATSWEEEQAKAAAARLRNQLEQRKLAAEAAKLERENMAGPTAFQGTGMEAQVANILLDPNLDPTSPVAQWAYTQATNPRTTFDPNTGQMITVQPRIPKFVSDKFAAQEDAQQPAESAGGKGPQIAGGRVVTEKVATGIVDINEQRRADEDRRKREEATKQGAQGLNNEYRKEYKPVQDGLTNVKYTRTLLASGTGVALAGALQKVQKLFDDGVVREEDIQRLGGTAGAYEQLKGAISKAQTGSAIPPAVRRQLAEVVDLTEKHLLDTGSDIESRYIEQAQVNGYDPQIVLGRRISQPKPRGQGPKPKVILPGQ